MATFGVFRGMITDTTDLNSRGRVRITIPVLGINSVNAPVTYTCSCAWGIQAGMAVAVAFEAGDVSRPIVLGHID